MNKTRQKIHDIIYEADTPAGKAFDILLIIVIIISVVLVALETVGWINEKYYNILNIAEWTITILFTVEYILRIISIHHQRKYIFLTEREILLLELLLESNSAVSKKDILKKVWNYSEGADTHTIETHIYRLRKKIKSKFEDENFIINTKNGYKI